MIFQQLETKTCFEKVLLNCLGVVYFPIRFFSPLLFAFFATCWKIIFYGCLAGTKANSNLVKRDRIDRMAY